MSAKPPVTYLHSSARKDPVAVKKPGFLRSAFRHIQDIVKSLLQERKYTISADMLDEYVGYPLFAGGHLKTGTTVLATYIEKEPRLNPFAQAGETVSFLCDVSQDGSTVKLQHTGPKGNGLVLNLKKLSPEEYEVCEYFYSHGLVSYGYHPVNFDSLGRFLGTIVPAINAMNDEGRKPAFPPVRPESRSHLRLV